jgi:SAM domain (Sterile alpha motif)
MTNCADRHSIWYFGERHVTRDLPHSFSRHHGRRHRLQVLDLKKHEAAFVDNSIDMDVVHELNENDLENLGLLLGDPKRVGEAIARKDPPAPTERAREGKLTAGDAFKIGFGALSEAERLSPSELLTGLNEPISACGVGPWQAHPRAIDDALHGSACHASSSAMISSTVES